MNALCLTEPMPEIADVAAVASAVTPTSAHKPVPAPVAGSVGRRVTFWSNEAGRPRRQELSWQMAVENAVEIMVNSQSVAVTMATPADFEDIAIGFLLSEGYVNDVEKIRRVMVLPVGDSFCVDVAVDEGAVERTPDRTTESRSGCGLCGISKLSDVRFDAPYRHRFSLSIAAVSLAMEALSSRQPMKSVNRSVHAAGFADRAGQLLYVREDIGRHNALDKLIGTMACNRIDPQSGFVVLSSRCSFELVRKAAIAGVGGLVTRSAPTQLALEIAEQAGLPLACCAPGGWVTF